MRVENSENGFYAEDCMVEMADGIRLYTQMEIPGPGKYPVVLGRDPYVSKDREQGLKQFAEATVRYAKAGFVRLYQHCRGCGLSEGDFIPYQNERADGLAMLAWIRKQPFYNGEIYIQGGSYCCSVHLSYLDTRPADVKGALLQVQDCNRYNILYRNGFYKSGLHGGWFVRQYKKNSMPKKNYVEDSFRMLPLTKFAETVFGGKVPVFQEELTHPDPEDAFWQTPYGGSDYRNAVKNLNIPTLFITGFYDIYTEGVIAMWRSIPEEIRSRCAMVITPYAHGYETPGAVEFPHAGLKEEWQDYDLNFFNAIRKKEKLHPFAEPGKIKWYSQFEEKWNSAPDLADGPQSRTLYIGNHTLVPTAAAPEELSYCYNPYAPAVFKGSGCLTFGGMQIQDAPDSRYDILSFLSAPFTKAEKVQGRMKLILHVKSDCPDTCFYARMSLVQGGNAYSMRDEITSLRRVYPGYRPGSTVELQLGFTENAFLIQEGDQIRLDISSSCYPHFVPHTNRAGAFYAQTGADIARNTVITGISSLTYYIL